MDVNYILAIDPGRATGVAIGRYTLVDPVEIIYTGIIPGGAVGFAEWLYNTNDVKSIVENDCSYGFPEEYDGLDWHIDVACEVFKPRGGNFAPDSEALRIEGIMIDHFGNIINWHSPSEKSLVNDSFLKEHDLWVTGKDVDHTDGRDANDALIHVFVYMMRNRHIPTLEAYWKK